tara:strand:+ start:18338 stop:18484 length:147 start_codon:yes stop_codon:yes gene_type:complete
MKLKHGTGLKLIIFIMPSIELQARIKEQKQKVKELKLKYRGVEYCATR